MEELSVVYIDPEKLTPWAGNAKQHPAWQVDQIKRSIEKYGMNDPVVVWGDHNIIVEGHGRLLACKELGMKEIPCIRLDYLTDEQRRAYTLAHNKTTMETGLSFTALQERLLQIESTLEEFGVHAIEQLDGVFDLPEEQPKQPEQTEAIFVVKVKREEMDSLFQILDDEGFDYEY